MTGRPLCGLAIRLPALGYVYGHAQQAGEFFNIAPCIVPCLGIAAVGWTGDSPLFPIVREAVEKGEPPKVRVVLELAFAGVHESLSRFDHARRDHAGLVLIHPLAF